MTPDNLPHPDAAATRPPESLTDHLLEIARCAGAWLMAEIKDDAARVIARISPGFPGRPSYAADAALIAWTADIERAYRFATWSAAQEAIGDFMRGDDYLARDLHLRPAPRNAPAHPTNHPRDT